MVGKALGKRGQKLLNCDIFGIDKGKKDKCPLGVLRTWRRKEKKARVGARKRPLASEAREIGGGRGLFRGV